MSNYITNSDKNTTLQIRLEQLIQHAYQLKFLVGFFYFSGWQELYETLKKYPELDIQVLVGLEVDQTLGRTLEVTYSAEGMSHAELTDRFLASIATALNDENLDIKDFYIQVEYFIELIENGRMQIRKTLEPNHAKLYFFKAGESVQGWLPPGETGKFITGSSNLTRAGIHGQNEFNVEIGDYGTAAAEKYFGDLWASAVPITEDAEIRTHLVQIVRNRTQAAPISPFEAYVLVLKTYLDLMELKTVHPYVTRLLEEQGYISYQYQLDAVNQALSIIEQYNGAIVADVVGLGKTIIACMIARDLGKRGLVICPPALIGDEHYQSGWRKYLADFELRKYEWDVFSSGNLKAAADYLQTAEGKDIEVIIVDEAHRFRNEDTENYEFLSAICRNHKVILLTATPFNNSPADIFAMLKLFIIPGKSPLTLDENLEGRFGHYNSEFRRLSYISRYYQTINDPEKKERAEKYYLEMFDTGLPIDIALVKVRTKQLADEIRAVLEPVLIRRNRLDLRNDPIYSGEITQLSNVHDPCELFYQLTPEQLAFYDQIVNVDFGDGGRFKGAIYQPFLYEHRKDVISETLDEEGNRTFLQQRNLYDFMRRLLVKRFESSFGAFAHTISNFEQIHEIVLTFIGNSGGKYILDRQLIEKIYEDDPEEIDTALEQFAKRLKEEKRIPKHERIYEIDTFEKKGEFLADIQSDLKLMHEISKELQNLKLIDEDSKADRLVEQLQKEINTHPQGGEPAQKVVIFSEYVDTVLHLQPLLEAAFPGQVLSVTGSISAGMATEILCNFDASIASEQQKNQYSILLTSDKLSEGVNLNRAGIIINYDIPWNPTRVIQRVGRINRIGKKVFQTLYIYNFFPTEQGADIIKSREIASGKMFMIHSTLGEDAKIFDIDEAPAPAELYKRINQNPEMDEEESLFTRIRQTYFAIQQAYPEIVANLNQYPTRVKTAKAGEKNQLVVFRRKGLGLFIQCIDEIAMEKPEVFSLMLEDALTMIVCDPDEARLPFSNYFWGSYECIKSHRDVFVVPKSANSIEVKALNNLQSALRNYPEELREWVPFIRTLVKDLRDFRTLPKYTLRRLVSVDLKAGKPERIHKFITELNTLRHYLGEDYLEIIQQRASELKSEVIIAVENRKVEE